MHAKRTPVPDALPLPPARPAAALRLVPGLLLLLACAAASADKPAPAPSDLHGALIVSSNYRYYASILYASESQARQSALAHCKENEPDAKCAVYSSFKNQCVAVAGIGRHHFVATGEKDWDQRQTRDFSLRLCREKTGSECKLLISACSTEAQKAADHSAEASPDAPWTKGFQAYRAPPVPR
ncbi:DUF4189 domain-containing protein [Achromobacter sp. NPDC058515]|uniref:DUF4189 domain-containing protein n=1 Tax=Achromobacter sp. NPDC058515 TaxID=3346533 RepID=UPI003658E26A